MVYFSKKFVCATRERSTYEKHVPAPLFRKSFTLKKAPEKAKIRITGLGFYQLFINGKDITKGFLAPYISNTDALIYYDDYDLTPYLTAGENVIGVMLGDGMQNTKTSVWDFHKVIFSSSPKLALHFAAESSGETLSFEADSFICTDGPVTFNDHRSGVHYDARLEKEGWNAPGYDDSDWRAPLLADPSRGQPRLCEAEPLRQRGEFKPVNIYPGGMEPYGIRGDLNPELKAIKSAVPLSGGYIYDFGKNSAGIFRMCIRNTTPGQKIYLTCTERVNKDAQATLCNINFYPEGYAQQDIYICKGGDEEIFIPPFVYHGYQYIYIHGIREEQATEELLTYIEMNSALTHRATFDCADPIVNRLYEMCDNSDLSNFHYFPTDCPHREKNGWTGDAAASAEHMVMTLSVENSWREWLRNICKAQNDEGGLPGIVPTYDWGFNWGNGPAWDRVLFDLPYYSYRYRGETEAIKECAHNMLRYLEFITRKRNEDGIVLFGLGDWCPTDHLNDEGTLPVHLGFTNGMMVMDMCRKGEEMFRAVGLELHADFAKRLWSEMRAAVRRQYLDEATMTIEGNYQTGQAMAVYYGLLDPAECKLAVEVLVDLIHRHDDHMSVGYLGARCIFHVLADYGYADLAYKMIARTDSVAYGVFAAAGMTTMPENFFVPGADEGSCNSYNHHFFCDIKHWFLRQLCGININPQGDNPNEILVQPHFVAGVDYAEGSYDAPEGSIYVRWEREGENLRLTVRPSGEVKMRVRLDSGYAMRLHPTVPNTDMSFLRETRALENMLIVPIVL